MEVLNNDNKPRLVVFLLLFILATIFRIYGIWEWELVGDEKFTAFHSNERYRSFTNPAYYFLVVITYDLFGNIEWLSRLPALVLGIISIPTLYYSWSKFVGSNAAFFAAIVLLFSAWHLWFSHYARFYIGVIFFGSLAYSYFFRAVSENQLSKLALAIIFSVIAMLFHATAALIPASMAVAYLYLWVFPPSKVSDTNKIYKYYIWFCVISILLISPIFIKIFNNWVNLGQTWGYGAFLIIPQIVKYIQLPIALAGFFGWVYLLSHWRAGAILFFFATAVPVLFIVLSSTLISVRPDYVIALLPVLAVLSGVLCEAVRKQLVNHSYVISNFVLVFIVISLLPSFASHYTSKRNNIINEAVSFIEKNYKDGDQILSFVSSFNYHTQKEYKLLPFISYERDDSTDWFSRLDEIGGLNNRFWVLVSHKRQALAKSLEKWLTCHARLVWRKQVTRLDYEVDGYDVFLVDRGPEDLLQIKSCQSNS